MNEDRASVLLYLYTNVYFFNLSFNDPLHSWAVDGATHTFAYKNPYVSSFDQYYKAAIQ